MGVRGTKLPLQINSSVLPLFFESSHSQGMRQHVGITARGQRFFHPQAIRATGALALEHVRVYVLKLEGQKAQLCSVP